MTLAPIDQTSIRDVGQNSVNGGRIQFHEDSGGITTGAKLLADDAAWRTNAYRHLTSHQYNHPKRGGSRQDQYPNPHPDRRR